jgi:tetratricopeptide (TPR) repeat protein
LWSAGHPRPASSYLKAILAIVIGMIACPSAFAQVHTTVRHHRELVESQPPEIVQAENAIQKNDFTSAETLLKKALATDPNNKEAWSYQAWFDLGFVLNRLDRADESIAAYRKSVAAKPDVFESNLNLGLMLARSRNLEAERFLRAATALKPTARTEEGYARAWLALAHLLENAKPQDALLAYSNASELTPNDPEPHLSAGLLHERQKEFPAAEAEYKQVLKLDPQSTEAVIGLTNIYMKASRLADAEPLLRQLSAKRPNDAAIHLQLGRVLVAQDKQEKKDEGTAEIQTALKLSPADSDAQRELADLLVQSKKFPEAEAIYRTLISVHPNDAGIHGQLGEVLLKEHKFPEAQQEFMTTINLKPDFGAAYGSLAVAANENQNYALTIKALDVRDKLQPEVPMSFFLRATALDHLQDYKHAALYYQRFLDAASGKYPNEEWKARHRLVWINSKKR